VSHPAATLPRPTQRRYTASQILMEKMWIAEERKDKTIYRRRCPSASDIITFLSVSGCALFFLLVCSILYGTRTENPRLPGLVKEVLPAGRCLCEFSTNFQCDTCLDCASNQAILAANVTEDDLWTFNYMRDKNDYGLDEEQCQSAFPGQYEDIERAVRVRGRAKVTEQDLNSFDLTKGMVRGMIYDREVGRARRVQCRVAPANRRASSTSSKLSSSTTSTVKKPSHRSAPCTAPSSLRPQASTSPTSNSSSPSKISPLNPRSPCGRSPAACKTTTYG
jgi:hypothetical protein